MLTLDGVEIVLGDFRLSADFSVERGARVAVIGPSGAGKSTLLGAIAGFLSPVRGQVFWDGTDMTDTEPGRRPISILFQDNNLFPHLTLFQNVALGLRPSLRLDADETARVKKALAQVGLGAMAGRKPGQLSGGQQSRAALARVLLRDRPLLLLDEPFAALGPALRTEMLDLVAGIADATGATLLMVTHEPRDARRIAASTILVADGLAHPPQETVVLLDDPPQVLRDYLH